MGINVAKQKATVARVLAVTVPAKGWLWARVEFLDGSQEEIRCALSQAVAMEEAGLRVAVISSISE